MSLKSLALASALTLGLSPAFAADQTVSFVAGGASFIGTAPILFGGDDVITFDNLASGTYNFLLSVSSQNVIGLSATLNGQGASILNSGVFSFANLQSTGNTDFALTLAGTAGSGAKYSGELTVTAVPEPGTYALLLAGLGVVSFIARRRRPA